MSQRCHHMAISIIIRYNHHYINNISLSSSHGHSIIIVLSSLTILLTKYYRDTKMDTKSGALSDISDSFPDFLWYIFYRQKSRKYIRLGGVDVNTPPFNKLECIIYEVQWQAARGCSTVPWSLINLIGLLILNSWFLAPVVIIGRVKITSGDRWKLTRLPCGLNPNRTMPVDWPASKLVLYLPIG